MFRFFFALLVLVLVSTAAQAQTKAEMEVQEILLRFEMVGLKLNSALARLHALSFKLKIIRLEAANDKEFVKAFEEQLKDELEDEGESMNVQMKQVILLSLKQQPFPQKLTPSQKKLVEVAAGKKGKEQTQILIAEAERLMKQEVKRLDALYQEKEAQLREIEKRIEKIK